MSIKKEKFEELAIRMEKIGIKEADILEKFILGSSSGGQKINKTASCVYLKHLPTGIEVKYQKTRSREANRFFARRALCEKLEKTLLQVKTDKEKETEKIRRQKKRRTRRQKEKMLKGKHLRGSTKAMRAKPEDES